MTTPSFSGAQFTVNTNPTGTQIDPRVAALSDGRSVIVWYEDDPLGPDPLAQAIRSQIVRADGTLEGPELLVNTFTTGGQFIPDVITLDNGGYAVTWQTTDPTSGDGSGSAIKAQIFDSAGGMVGTEFLVNNTFPANQFAPVMTALDDGGFAVAFWTAAGNSDIMMRLFDADGTPRGAQFLVNLQPALIQRLPEITTLENGNILVVWNQFGGSVPATHDTSQNGVVGRIFTAAGVAVTGHIAINTSTTRHQQDAEAAGLVGGGFVVTWMDDSQASADNLFNAVRAQVFDDLGNKVGAEILVNTTVASNQNEPSVTALSDGRFLIAWTDASDGDGQDIRAQLFNADGTASGSELLISVANTGNQVEPSVEELSDGRIMVSWRDVDDVVAQIIDPREAAISFSGTSAAEISVGTRFNDALVGRGGADVLKGAGGNDRITGGTGADTLDGGDGIDTLNYSTSTVGVSVDLLAGTGSAGDAAGDQVSGFERVTGSAHNDTLVGSAGRDTLTGGVGGDVLTGGAGRDFFDYNALTESTVASPGRDLIIGFNPANQDRIDLSTIDADNTLPGNDAFIFIGSGPFTALGQVRVYQLGTETFIDINATGNLDPDMSIALSGLLVLDAADFLL